MADKGENITTRFKVDISDLKAGISEANKQIKLANAEFKAATAGMDDWAKSADGIKAKLSQLESVLSAQKSKLAAYEQELERNNKAAEENGKRAAELRKQLQELAANGVSKTSAEYKTLEKELIATEKEQASNQKAADDLKLTILNQQAAVASTEKELRKYSNALDDVGNEEKDTAKESGDTKKGIKEVGDEAEKTEKKTNGLAKSLANGLKKGLVAVGTAAAAAVSGLAAAAVGAGDYADEILELSTKTGISTDKLQELQYASELVDTSLDTITGSMKKNIMSMQKAAKGSGDAADAYKKLGISVKNSDGTLRDSEDVYWEIIDALGKMDAGTERDALAMSLLGKSAQDLNPLIETGSDRMAELAKEAQDAGAVMSGEALSAMGEFDDQMEKLKSGAGAAKNALGTVLMPALGELAGKGVSLLADFTKGVNDAGGDWGKISKVVGDTIGKMADVIMEELPKIIEMGLEIVMSLARSIVQSMPKLIESAAKLVPTVVQQLVSDIPTLINGAVELFLSIAKAIPIILPELVKAIPQIIGAIVKTLIQNIPKILEAAGQIWQGIKNVFAPVVNWFRDKFSAAWQAVKNVFSAGGKIFEGIKEAISDVFKKVVNAIIRGINKVIAIPFNAINKVLNKIRNAQFLGIQPFKNLGSISVPQIPLLAQGGVLRRGQVGLLEGDGAEAVVPLDKNKAWISAVAGDMLKRLEMSAGNSLSNISNNKAVTFTQNIYSPKAPSRIDVYRQTKNLLSFAEAGGF